MLQRAQVFILILNYVWWDREITYTISIRIAPMSSESHLVPFLFFSFRILVFHYHLARRIVKRINFFTLVEQKRRPKADFWQLVRRWTTFRPILTRVTNRDPLTSSRSRSQGRQRKRRDSTCLSPRNLAGITPVASASFQNTRAIPMLKLRIKVLLNSSL